jgi:hypothetical protein
VTLRSRSPLERGRIFLCAPLCGVCCPTPPSIPPRQGEGGEGLGVRVQDRHPRRWNSLTCAKCMAGMSFTALLSFVPTAILHLSLRRRPYPPPSAGCYATRECAVSSSLGADPTAVGVSSSLAFCPHFRFRLRPKSQGSTPRVEPLFLPVSQGRLSMRRTHGCRSGFAFATTPRQEDYPSHQRQPPPLTSWSPRKRKTFGLAHPLGRGLFIRTA